MYVPNHFAESDHNKLHDLIELHSFATLVSVNGREPFASHLPLLLDRDNGPHGTLIGHLARANPQWRAAEGQRVLAIFHGPHTYVSPTWYETTNVVPTWNYVAVHAYGTLRLETDRRRLLDIVRRYVEFYEADQPHPWSIEQAAPDFVDGLLGGIVGFTIVIDQIEGKWKLNQNHDPARREKVIQRLRKAGGETNRAIADLMSQNLER